MKTIEIFEDNLDKKDVKGMHSQCGARAVLVYQDKYVVIFNRHWNLYTLPGGGIDKGETPEEALQREVLEETGFTVSECKKTILVKEYFHDSVWEHHFFLCKANEAPKSVNLTDEEKAAGMEVHYKTFNEVLTLFNEHQSTHHHAEAIYQREFLGFVHSVES